jgi:SAM-dependent methyltransferase
MAGERHQVLAGSLPVAGGGPVVDLGCGCGLTLRALRERLGADVGLVGVERELPTLGEELVADANVRAVAADLNEPLPFADASFGGAVCHNTLECLPGQHAFLGEVARVLRPGGHLLLSHTDFDTTVFNSADIELTRRMVHANTDTQEAWMDASDGAIGRKVIAIARRSPFELADTLPGWSSTLTSPKAVPAILPCGASPRQSGATVIPTSRRASMTGSKISARSPGGASFSSASTTTPSSYATRPGRQRRGAVRPIAARPGARRT